MKSFPTTGTVEEMVGIDEKTTPPLYVVWDSKNTLRGLIVITISCLQFHVLRAQGHWISMSPTVVCVEWPPVACCITMLWWWYLAVIKNPSGSFRISKVHMTMWHDGWVWQWKVKSSRSSVSLVWLPKKFLAVSDRLPAHLKMDLSCLHKLLKLVVACSPSPHRKSQ